MQPVGGVGNAAAQAARIEGSPGRAFSEVLGQVRSAGSGAAAAGPAAAVLRTLGRLDAGQRRLDQIIAQGRAGRLFRPGELLALQAEVHRLGEEAALVQRVAEEGAGAVKRLWSVQL